MKKLPLCLLGLCLISGCAAPIEPTFDAMSYLTPETHINYSDTEDSEPTSSWWQDIPVEQTQLIIAYEKYMETDAFKYFVECVDYGQTLESEYKKSEPEVDLNRLADLTIESGNRFLDENVELAVEFGGERYLDLLEMHKVQVTCVEDYISGAEFTKEYLDDNSKDIEMKAGIAFEAANDNFFKVRDALDEFDYNPVFD